MCPTSLRFPKTTFKRLCSSFEPMNTDIYCDVCIIIIILCVQIICITPVLLYAIKYLIVVLCKSVGVV